MLYESIALPAELYRRYVLSGLRADYESAALPLSYLGLLKSPIIALEDSRVKCVGEGLKKSRNQESGVRNAERCRIPYHPAHAPAELLTS